jgi:phage tail sheath gpL-like
MPVQFNNIPGNLRVPLFYAEFNPGASPYQSLSRLLLIGQKIAAGTAVVDVPIQVSGNETGLFGGGSMLERMFKFARRNAPFQEIWALPLADHASGVAAAGQFTITNAPPASAGQLTVYIAGQRVRIAVSTADTAAAIATRLAAQINAQPDLPVTAAVNGVDNFKVDVTAKNDGTPGNKIRLEIDYYGDEGPLASELVTTITAMASGATDVDITAKLAALGDMEFDFIAAPYTDATNLAAINAFLNDASGRWSPIQMLYGHYFSAKDDTQANLSTFGNGLNDRHVSVMGYNKSPSPPWEWCAAFAANAAAHLQAPPELSRPLQTLELQGILPPKSVADRFSIQQRNSLYYDGVSSYHVRRDNKVCIDRAITTYQTNDWGAPDMSFLDVETMFQGQYFSRYLKAKVTQQWGRSALADENPLGVIGLCTPADMRNTVLHGYQELVQLGVVENIDLFEAGLIVERNVSDPNRLDALLPMDHVNQLRLAAFNITSNLQLAQVSIPV